MKDLVVKNPALIAKVLIEALIEKAHQKKIQNKIDYITDVTTAKVDSVHSQTYQIICKKIENVRAITDSIYNTLEKDIDKLTPQEVLYLMDLIQRAQSTWNLNQEEYESIIRDLNNTSFQID